MNTTISAGKEINSSNLHGKTVGILGGGQLGRMMVQAASKLNVECFVLDDTVDAPAKQLIVSENGIIGEIFKII